MEYPKNNQTDTLILSHSTKSHPMTKTQKNKNINSSQNIALLRKKIKHITYNGKLMISLKYACKGTPDNAKKMMKAQNDADCRNILTKNPGIKKILKLCRANEKKRTETIHMKHFPTVTRRKLAAHNHGFGHGETPG